jgi:hypothetical protein
MSIEIIAIWCDYISGKFGNWDEYFGVRWNPEWELHFLVQIICLRDSLTRHGPKTSKLVSFGSYLALRFEKFTRTTFQQIAQWQLFNDEIRLIEDTGKESHYSLNHSVGSVVPFIDHFPIECLKSLSLPLIWPDWVARNQICVNGDEMIVRLSKSFSSVSDSI